MSESFSRSSVISRVDPSTDLVTLMGLLSPGSTVIRWFDRDECDGFMDVEQGSAEEESEGRDGGNPCRGSRPSVIIEEIGVAHTTRGPAVEQIRPARSGVFDSHLVLTFT